MIYVKYSLTKYYKKYTWASGSKNFLAIYESIHFKIYLQLISLYTFIVLSLFLTVDYFSIV